MWSAFLTLKRLNTKAPGTSEIVRASLWGAEGFADGEKRVHTSSEGKKGQEKSFQISVTVN